MGISEETKLMWKVLGWFIAASIVLGIVGWVGGWVSLPGRKTSVKNVEEQWEWAYSMEEDLKAAAVQVCNARSAYEQEVDQNAKTQWLSHVVAREDNYARIVSDYNDRLRNAFEAKYVRPDDVRERAPSLENMIEEVCK